MNEQILNKMNGQHLLEFLTQNTIGRIRYHRAKSDGLSASNIVAKRETLSNTDFIKFV